MRINERISGIEGASPGGVANIQLPRNRRFHWLKFFMTATVDAAPDTDPTHLVEWVRLYVNGVLIRDVTPAQLLAIAAMNGITPEAGELPIYFSEPWRASVMDEQVTAWDMFGQTSFTVQIKLAASYGGDPISALTLTGLDSYDYGRAMMDGKPVLNIIKYLPTSVNAGTQYDITSLQVGFPIQRILLQGSQNITRVLVKADSIDVYEATEQENTALLNDYGLDAAEFNFPIVFDVTQQVFDSLNVRKDLVIQVTSAGAQTIPILVEQRVPGYL